jgi:DDE superfamily endonuclease
MFNLTNEVASVLAPFQILFVQQRSWQKAQEMLVGAILCRGKRTVSRVLTVMGLAESPSYGKYYRVLNRVGWSGLKGAQILLGMILALLTPSRSIVIGIDETLELTVRSFFLVLRKLVKRYMWSFEPALLDDLLEF